MLISGKTDDWLSLLYNQCLKAADCISPRQQHGAWISDQWPQYHVNNQLVNMPCLPTFTAIIRDNAMQLYCLLSTKPPLFPIVICHCHYHMGMNMHLAWAQRSRLTLC